MGINFGFSPLGIVSFVSVDLGDFLLAWPKYDGPMQLWEGIY